MDGGRGRERKRVSPFPEPVSLFITIMSALLSPFPPTKISHSQQVTSCGDLAERRAGLRNEASQGPVGGGFTLPTRCRTEGRQADGMLRTASGGDQCHTHVQGEI